MTYFVLTVVAAALSLLGMAFVGATATRTARISAAGVLTALLAWFAERGVGHVDLHASSSGEQLYRAAGFTEPSWPALRWRP